MRPLAPLALLALALASTAHAGPIAVPGAWAEGGVFEAAPDAAPVAVRFAEVAARAGADRADARLTWRLAPADGAHALLVPLAPTVGEAPTVTLDGAPVGGWLLSPRHARPIITALARATDDTSLLAHLGRPAFFAPAVTLGKQSTLALAGRFDPAATGALRRLSLPLPLAGPDGPARVRAEITLDVEPGAGRLHTVLSPTHPVRVQRAGPHAATVRLDADRGAGEWALHYVVDPSDLGLHVVTHRPDPEQDGYFLLLATPLAAADAAPVAKDVVIALDTSGSMRGEKMEQARMAVADLIDRLGPADRFNIVAFGTEARAFAEAPIAADAAVAERARAWVEALVAHGRTNLADALDAALAGESGRPRIVLLITDGAPTAGLREPDQIIATVPADTPSRIFALGVGDDVNAHLLDKLSARTGGYTTYVDPDDAIDAAIATLYDGLSHPALADVKLDFGNLAVRATHPDAIPQLFRGQDVLVAGRFGGGGTHTVTLTGLADGTREQHTVTVDFPTRAHADDSHVASLWATRRIGELLRRLRLDDVQAKDAEALIAEVVELSRHHGIITEYTAWLDEGIEDTAEALDRTTSLVQQARTHQSGRWAVRQADNEQALRHRKTASVATNTYRDRQGRVQSADNVRMMNGRAWYKRGERWVEADDGKDRRHRRVKKFSPEHMKLVEQHRDVARAQSLDGDITINVGDERVEIY